jgi:glycosyltransferase involved in cell wall biosynthesis
MAMNLVMVVEHPTQFEGPLFRHAARDGAHRLRVLYTDPAAGRARVDPEIGRHVDWGADALRGHDHAVAPAAGRRAWLREQLAARQDLVIVNGYTRPAYLAAIAAARRAGSPLGLRLDSVAFDEGAGPRRLVKRALFRWGVRPLFDLFFGVGSLTLEYLRGLGVPGSRTALLPYPVDAAGFRRTPAAAERARAAWRARLGTPPGAPVVLAVHKLHPRETPWDLLHAWPAAAAADRWLWMAGDGPDRGEVERFVRERGLQRVVMLGYAPYSDLPELYAAADLLVHAPRVERWGVSVGEALACGLPVVTSSLVGAAHDLVDPGRTGAVYPAGEPDALAGAISSCLGLDRAAVDALGRERLAAWGPEAAWRNMLEAARGLASGAR